MWDTDYIDKITKKDLMINTLDWTKLRRRERSKGIKKI